MPVNANAKIRPRSYLRSIINILINPRQIKYYVKQINLVRKFQGRLKLKKYAIDLKNNIDINIDSDACLNFKGKSHLSEGVRISVLDSAVVTIGDNCFINRNSSIVSRYGITIGNDCMIAESVYIYDHDHVFNNLDVPFCNQSYVGAPIIIGNNVWIGSCVLVAKGVSIGDNVVIAAGSIITKNIPKNSIARTEAKLLISDL